MSRPVLSAVLLSATLALTACGHAGAGAGAASPATAGDAYPVTVKNCGAEVTFAAPPERVVLLKSASVPFLRELDVLDRVTARAGQYPAGYYDEDTRAELDEIPLLTDRTDTAGHLQISRETVIGQEPDLVVGEVDNLSRGSLAAVGIPLLEEPGLCDEGLADPGFDDVEEQLRTYGRVFDRPEQAEAAVVDLRARVRAVEDRVGAGSGLSAAVLYPTVGGGTTYAYGTRSMAQPQLEAAGLENVFGNVDERVFEVTLEELLGRDPDVLVLLHGDGDPAAVEAAVADLPGAERLTALREGRVVTQLFNFTEPPTPLSVTGLENLVDRLEEVAP
ncbi:ABC transporter substrate-binding protein [Nocardioides sp. SOB77]|uniref:ABC transporter substrate-binding protein n=1 Tax=Nocardioides oceani TaxID=3058369 RepID=A0ABT8FJT9_9ACTN|nr:ABC transporter substrate-binding protein [Nocardioides oceani]MDN4174946.1 ABC transporter substrate-binding protein [Nocardioides oceani]